MLSKSRVKYIKSLEYKKYRDEHGVFLAEGNKLVSELIDRFACELLVAKPSWMATQGDLDVAELVVANDDDIRKASLLKSPQDVLAVFRKPDTQLQPSELGKTLSLALDGVQDPGNLGTIVRIADWFGIGQVICSPNCADIYNPKTVQSTMGALARVQMHYTDLPTLLKSAECPVYGALLSGNNIYSETLESNGIIVMGSEGQGIGNEVAALLTHRLYIPNYPQGYESSESLNVAVATSIICAEFRRREVQPVQV